MGKRYLLLAFRNLMRSRYYSIINICGLAVSMFAIICVVLYVEDELSFDDFHLNGDRIFRIWNLSNGRKLAITPPLWAQYLKQDMQQVEQVVTLQPINTIVHRDNEPHHEDLVFATDSSFFHIFDFPVIFGRKDQMLMGPSNLVISGRAAKRYFGSRDPIGEVVELDLFGTKEDFVVSGVLHCPRNSHLQFDFIVPRDRVKLHFHNPQYYESWTVSFVYTYVLLKKQATAFGNTQFKEFLYRHGGEDLQRRFAPDLEPMRSIYLQSNLLYDSAPRSSQRQLHLLILSALVLLVVALTNFINLVTAQSMRRTKEVGLRKVFGSDRSAIFLHFQLESSLLACLAMIIALLGWCLFRDSINVLADKEFLLLDLLNIRVGSMIILMPITAGVLGGAYPAMILSKLKPARTLRSKTAYKFMGDSARKILIVFQFGVTACMISSASIIYLQVGHLGDFDKGITKEQVMTIEDSGTVSSDPLRSARLKAALSQIDEVKAVSVSSNFPGQDVGSGTYIPEGFNSDESMSLSTFYADFDFVRTYQISIIKGRDFSELRSEDSTAFLINESAMRVFANKDATWLTAPIGKEISYPALGRIGKVIGVFRDFNFQSVLTNINPLVITSHPTRIFVVQMRLQTDELQETIAGIQDVWRDLFPDIPFKYNFVDDTFAMGYRTEKKLADLFFLVSALCIFIAVIGLFGLVSFISQEKARELSIRKVIGARSYQLIWLLTWKFNSLVLIGAGLGVLFSMWLCGNWLAGFPFRIDLPWIVFLLVWLLCLLISTLSTCYHAFRVASQNPALILSED